MKKITFFILLFLIVKTLFPQLNITKVTPQVAVNNLVGSGVAVSNVSFIGNNNQLATFTNGSSYFGFNEGIILTTGDADFAHTTNNSNSGENDPLNPQPTAGSEIDLSQLLSVPGSNILYSPAVLEFDFVSNGKSVEFYFVFASEEYPKYAPPDDYDFIYNDVFGLFLSGPGIDGSFSNNGENIALVPNSTDYICVKNVNTVTHSNYFIPNYYSGNWTSTSLTYGGYTTTIKAEYEVECGQTYHLRIGISNVNDYLYDAAVMLKKGSLNSDFAPGQLTAYPMTICEGDPLLLTLENSDASWNYQWSTGNSGVGLSQITTNANYNSSLYSVTVTNTDGCSVSRDVDVVVHPLNNVAPYVNGINNSGEYTAYVQAGHNLQFTIPSFDNPEEDVIISWNNGISGATFISANGDQYPNHKKGVFSWTPSTADIGVHYFTVTVTDNNYCSQLSQTFTFEVDVVCSFCPIDVYYENRTPQQNPLPNLTMAGHKITAGEDVDPTQTNGPVNTENTEVIFKAPEILLKQGFSAGPGFSAIRDNTSCIDLCNECCENWSGFTFDFIPNAITPNDDGYNDVWYVPDVSHPYCAFNAQGFDLQIFNRWDVLVYRLSQQGDDCCPFRAPSPSNPIEYSSIYWDGYTNGGNLVTEGVYYYVLTLTGCSTTSSYAGSISVYYSSKSMVSQTDNSKDSAIQDISLRANEESNCDLKIFPNPVSDKLFVMHSYSSVTVELFSELGQFLSAKYSQDSMVSLDLSSFEPGIYYLRIIHDNGVEEREIIKR